MKKALLIFISTAFLSIAFCLTAMAASPWYQTADGIWHVYAANGDTLHDCWFCDDLADSTGNTWYLIDSYGNMISGALIQDGSGNYYSLETSHNGRYGALRTESGTYDGVYVTINNSHDGTYGCITDSAAIEQLKAKFGLVQVPFRSSAIVMASNAGGASASAISASEATISKDPVPTAQQGVSTPFGPGTPGATGTFSFEGKTYVIDHSWGQHYLTGYSGGGFTRSGTVVTPKRTASGPSSLLGSVILVKGVSGPASRNCSEYDGVYRFEDTGGPAVETGIATTMNKPVVDLYQATVVMAAQPLIPADFAERQRTLIWGGTGVEKKDRLIVIQQISGMDDVILTPIADDKGRARFTASNLNGSRLILVKVEYK